MTVSSARLFRILVTGWLALYMLALLGLGTAAWNNAPVNILPSGWNAARWMEHAVNDLPPWSMIGLSAITLGLAVLQLRRPQWWPGLVAWLLFRIITHRTWLASNGGVQLMENMLLWAAFVGSKNTTIASIAFWIARLQLLVAYAGAAAHKFTGTTWLDGTAVLRVAHDPLFHLGWLAQAPALCTGLTYLTLAWMTAFPLAVWWKWPRRIVLTIGVLFHLATAVFMDIPQMGLAFIACYALWLEEEDIAALRTLIPRRRP